MTTHRPARGAAALRSLAPLLLLAAAPPLHAQGDECAGAAVTAATAPLRPGDVIRLRIWRDAEL